MAADLTPRCALCHWRGRWVSFDRYFCSWLCFSKFVYAPSTKRSRNSASLDAESKQEPLALKPAGLTCPSRTTWSGLRTHLKDLHPGWDPPADWMEVSGSKACPSCGHGVVALSTARCSAAPTSSPRPRWPICPLSRSGRMWPRFLCRLALPPLPLIGLDLLALAR